MQIFAMVNIELQKSAPVAEGPIEHLYACHRRIEQRLGILERAGEHLSDRTEEALAAITNSLRFLDSSGALHTQDEEESLFPRLREHLSMTELAYLSELETQHDDVDSLYLSLKQAAGLLNVSVDARTIECYRQAVEELISVYRTHIQSEDAVLLEMSRQALTASELFAIQQEMRSRRMKAAAVVG